MDNGTCTMLPYLCIRFKCSVRIYLTWDCGTLGAPNKTVDGSKINKTLDFQGKIADLMVHY